MINARLNDYQNTNSLFLKFPVRVHSISPAWLLNFKLFRFGKATRRSSSNQRGERHDGREQPDPADERACERPEEEQTRSQARDIKDPLSTRNTLGFCSEINRAGMRIIWLLFHSRVQRITHDAQVQGEPTFTHGPLEMWGSKCNYEVASLLHLTAVLERELAI